MEKRKTIRCGVIRKRAAKRRAPLPKPHLAIVRTNEPPRAALVVAVRNPRKPYEQWFNVAAFRCSPKGDDLVLAGMDARGNNVTITIGTEALCEAFERGRKS